jgi:hypothetical protein
MWAGRAAKAERLFQAPETKENPLIRFAVSAAPPSPCRWDRRGAFARCNTQYRTARTRVDKPAARPKAGRRFPGFTGRVGPILAGLSGPSALRSDSVKAVFKNII